MRKKPVFCGYVIGTAVSMWLLVAVIHFFKGYVFFFVKLIS